MNLFYNIFLHRKLRLEDFCTDILVSILQKESNYSTLEKFVRNVLKISNIQGQISIQGQVSFSKFINNIDETDEDNNGEVMASRIDIEIKCESFLCFVEVKVESKENVSNSKDGKKTTQLGKYKSVLEKEKQEDKEIFLRYCTKYSELKSELKTKYNPNLFYQFRWLDVFKFLENENILRKDQIIEEFLNFLKMMNMDNKTVELSEINIFSRTLNLLSKLEIIISNLEREFKPKFGTITSKYKGLDLVLNRYGLHYIENLRNCNIFIGFTLEEKGLKSEINIWNRDFKNLSKKDWNFDNDYMTYKSDKDPSGGYYKTLMLNESKNLIDIEEWFVENINRLR
ncbi:MAG: hypothetical protein ACK4NY_18030 [Spirosomataceae bacterium]